MIHSFSDADPMELFREEKCGVLFQHVLEKHPDQVKSTYQEAG